jgi:hypothetical protein
MHIDALLELVLLLARLEALIGDVERGQNRERVRGKSPGRVLHLRDLLVHERGQRVEALLAGVGAQGEFLPGDLDRHGALGVSGRSWTPAPVMSTWTMPLQNRVTPFGEIIATPERGTMLGNRGILHDEEKRLVRTSHVRRWLACVLEWKGIRRTLMRPRSYTELFFLDEATAFAAGHRPCFECRRKDALEFQRCWAEAFGAKALADDMDRVLGADRRVRGGGKVTFVAEMRALPDATFIARDGSAWLVHAGRMLRWTPGAYAEVAPVCPGKVEVLTPRAMVEVLRAGYRPALHRSAAGAANDEVRDAPSLAGR